MSDRALPLLTFAVLLLATACERAHAVPGWIATAGRGPLTPGKPDTGFTIHDAESGDELARNANRSDPRWSPDGRRIAYIQNYSEVWIYEVESGTAEPILTVETCIEQAHGYGSAAAWTLDGRYMATHISASRGRWEHTWYTVILDFETRQMKIIHDGWTHLAWLPHPVGEFD